MPAADQFIAAANATRPLYVGIDVGGTSIKLGLVDDEGRPLAFRKMPTDIDLDAEQIVLQMGNLLRQMIQQTGVSDQDVARLGIATPGPIDVTAGIVVQPGNLPKWWNFPVRDRVHHHTGMEVTFANDANAAAYGEYWRGIGRQHEAIILLTLGTGIGGGIIINDMIIDGQHGCGSECGHIIIDCSDNAPSDSLGKSGSLEAHCNASAVVARAAQKLTSGRESSINDRVTGGDLLTPLIVAEEAEQGDQLAREVVFQTARYLAVGIVSLVHTIDPDCVILGGAMNFGGAGHPLGEEFISHVRDEAERRMMRTLRGRIAIKFASLGGDAGFIGAAGLARREFKG